MTPVDEKTPIHIAIIMDGNGRWAAARGMPRLEGHRAGTENLRQIIRASVEFGVKYLTLYAFSTENWGRPKEEVNGLLTILESVIDRELKNYKLKGYGLFMLGALKPCPKKCAKKSATQWILHKITTLLSSTLHGTTGAVTKSYTPFSRSSNRESRQMLLLKM